MILKNETSISSYNNPDNNNGKMNITGLSGRVNGINKGLDRLGFQNVAFGLIN